MFHNNTGKGHGMGITTQVAPVHIRYNSRDFLRFHGEVRFITFRETFRLIAGAENEVTTFTQTEGKYKFFVIFFELSFEGPPHLQLTSFTAGCQCSSGTATCRGLNGQR